MPIMLADADLWIPAPLRAWLRRMRLKWREAVKTLAKVDPKTT
jgi:hypothetical protein